MTDDQSIGKLASILRIDRHTLEQLDLNMKKVTGKSGIFKKIAEENEASIARHLDILGLGRHVSVNNVYDALISKVEADDLKIFQALEEPDLTDQEQLQKVIDLVVKISNKRKGFFIKKEVARKFIEKEPPPKIMKALGYENKEELLAKEDLFEIFSAIRFLEDSVWLNNVFFKQYEELKPEDFEERNVVAMALDKKWAVAAEKFVKKKYHNVGHLKELGIIFIVPISLGTSGETIRLISLLSHYFNEIYFYSGLFKQFVNYETNFSQNIISLLRGDVIDGRLPVPAGENWPRFYIIQRYLAKEDENDWRLFEPHVNPEAIHWNKAENDIIKISDVLPTFKNNLDFWRDLGWVGDFFKDEVGKDILVSFNLVDTAMALVKEKEMIKYLYHHQEALWNKIFTSYFNEARLAALIEKHILDGWFEA